MHGNVTLAGPLWWVASALFVGAIALGLFIVIDALLPARSARFAELPESRWVYIVICGLYVIGAIVAQFVRIAALAVSVSIGAPFMVVLGLVYLLRVVFPKHVSDE